MSRIPPGWEVTSFGDAVEPQSDGGKRVAQKDYLTSGRFPIVDQGEGLVGGFTNDEGVLYDGPLPVLVFGDHTRRTKYVDFRFAVGAQGVKLLVPRLSWSAKYLGYLIPTLPIPDKGYSRHYQFLRQQTFQKAPRAEQDRIVAEIEKHFTRLDAAVTSLKQAQAKLKAYRASVLRAAVTGRLMSDSFTIADPLPTGWRLASLGGLLREPLRNGHSAKASQDGRGVRTLTLTAVTNNDFSEANVKVTTANARKVADLWLQPDDILVERSNTPELVGTAARFSGPPGFAIFPDLMIRVRLNESADPRYVEALLHSDQARHHFRLAAQGIAGSMPKISQEDVAALPVPLPPIDAQTSIVAELERRLSVANHLVVEIETAVKQAARLRTSILAAAFAGRLVPETMASAAQL